MPTGLHFQDMYLSRHLLVRLAHIGNETRKEQCPGECRRNYSAVNAQVAGSNPVAAATDHPQARYSRLSDRFPNGDYGRVAQSEEQVMFRHPFVAGTQCQGPTQLGRVPHPECESRRFNSFIPGQHDREECLRGYLSFNNAKPRNILSSHPNTKGRPRRMPKELHASNQTGSPGGSTPPLAIAQTANARPARGGSRRCFFSLVAGGHLRRSFHDDIG